MGIRKLVEMRLFDPAIKNMYEIEVSGAPIFCLEFAGLKQQEMIELVRKSKDYVIETKVKRKFLVLLTNSNYFTPDFLDAFKNYRREEAIQYVDRMTFVGISKTQQTILRGYNHFFNRSVLIAATREEGIAQLLG